MRRNRVWHAYAYAYAYMHAYGMCMAVVVGVVYKRGLFFSCLFVFTLNNKICIEHLQFTSGGYDSASARVLVVSARVLVASASVLLPEVVC